MRFLTDTISRLKAGEDIEADSFEEAERKCPDGYIVIGEFVGEIDTPEFDNINLN